VNPHLQISGQAIEPTGGEGGPYKNLGSTPYTTGKCPSDRKKAAPARLPLLKVRFSRPDGIGYGTRNQAVAVRIAARAETTFRRSAQ
jgi:hypothetical protein